MVFSLEFNFPSYFGKNWDALYDCLTDLRWLKEKNILIVHDDLPFEEIKKKWKFILICFQM